MKIDVINTMEDVKAACAQLERVEPVFGKLLAQTGLPPLRRRAGGFEGLVNTIVSQQLSTSSAGAIWKRLEACVVPLTPETYLNCEDEELRACGLSAGKVRTILGLAHAIVNNTLNLDALVHEPDEQVRDALIVLKGIGPWSADIYLLACLGRADVWPAGDLALQKAIERGFGLSSRPSADQTEEMSADWRPWRAIAARVLWSYYALPVLPSKTETG